MKVLHRMKQKETWLEILVCWTFMDWMIMPASPIEGDAGKCGQGNCSGRRVLFWLRGPGGRGDRRYILCPACEAWENLEDRP